MIIGELTRKYNRVFQVFKAIIEVSGLLVKVTQGSIGGGVEELDFFHKSSCIDIVRTSIVGRPVGDPNKQYHRGSCDPKCQRCDRFRC